MTKNSMNQEQELAQIHEITHRELFNIEAEQTILGTIIINNEYINRVVDFLLPEHFYEPANQKIFEKISHTVNNINIIANKVTLKQFFENDETVKAVGGSAYLANLLSKATGIIDINDYAKLVYDLALKRQLVMIGEDIVSDAYHSDEDLEASAQVEAAENKLFNLTSNGGASSDFQNISHPLKITLEKTLIARERDSSISGISTGLDDLDKILSGMQNSDLIILAGRPSMGKTALAINIVVNACKFLNKDVVEEKDKKAVGFFSLEMSSDQLSARILSMETSINATKFRSGEITEEDWEVITARSAEISNMPLFIDDTPAITIPAMRSKVRRMVRKHNLSFLVIDYLQLIDGSGGKSSDGRVQEISQITRGLKAIAKEFNIPVMALSQLSRAVEQREDKRPQLSDLRESGSIEQDADIVSFIFRESYYEERKRPGEDEKEKFDRWKIRMDELRNRSELIIAKQRNGAIGSVHLYFDPEFTRFNNLDIYH
ncbi:MAG: replicative DNA helicase [Lentimonas sp.]|jgi:replicative DNA helicase